MGSFLFQFGIMLAAALAWLFVGSLLSSQTDALDLLLLYLQCANYACAYTLNGPTAQASWQNMLTILGVLNMGEPRLASPHSTVQ